MANWENDGEGQTSQGERYAVRTLEACLVGLLLPS